MQDFNFIKAMEVSQILNPITYITKLMARVVGGTQHSSKFSQNVRDSEKAIREDWLRVGNDMRYGVLEYDRKLIKK